MTNELDNLRPEVRRANSFLDSMACSEDERVAVHTIRAALLRLVGDLNAACLSRDTFEARYQCMRERAERAEAAQAQAQPAQDAALYQELLMAVSKKFPNESRHETALRYIKQTELQSCEPKCDAAMAKESRR